MMSSDQDLEDLEEGEITENISFDLRYGLKSESNVTNVSKKRFSPIIHTMFDRKSDQLFGSSDTDLRFVQNNSFNDCDDRLIADMSATRHRHPIYGQNSSFVGHSHQNHNLLRPKLNETNYMPLNDNRFHSLSMRPKMSSFSPTFRLSENQRPLQMRPQMTSINALLPTPVMPFRPTEPNRPFLPYFLFRRGFDPQMSNQSFMSSIPQPDCVLTPNRMPYSFVASHSSQSNPMIPFISDSNISESEIRRNDESFDSKVNQFLSDCNNKTIITNSNKDIKEVVDMQLSDDEEDLSPYDPEQDITTMCTTLSPSFQTKDENNDKTEETKTFENENQSKSDAKSKLNDSVPFRSEIQERNERLNRLLKCNFDVKKKCKRHQNRPPMKRSIRMTPKTQSKFKPLSPIREPLIKVSVHSKTCRKGHTSRRKVKRMAKKEIIFQNSIKKFDKNFHELRHKSRKNFIDNSYEDLLEEYKRIQNQLKELENEEKTEADIKSGIDREEEENIEKLMSSHDIPEINDDLNAKLNSSEDEEELELRRLALESKKKRELEEQEDEELILRQQLLQSLFKSKPKVETQMNDSNEANANSVKDNSRPEPLEEILVEINTAIINTTESETTSKAETQTQKPLQKLIIHFGDDSTDEEQEIQTKQSDSLNQFSTEIDSLLREGRLSSNTTPSLPLLSITQQREYQELRAEIARREQNQINDTKLKQNEVLWKASKKRLEEKTSKQNLLKSRVIIKRNALRKAQIQARKMQEAFIAATRVVSATASELNSFKDELNFIDNDVIQENLIIGKYEKECIRMGLKLYGNTYKLPIGATVKRSNSFTPSSGPHKKRLKSESNENNSLSKEEIENEKKRLIQRLNDCTKLLDLKKSNQLKSLPPKTLGSNSLQTKNQINIKTKDSHKLLQTLAKHLMTTPLTHSLISFDSFVENMFSIQHNKDLKLNITLTEGDGQLLVNYKTSSDNTYDSVLSHLHSYRLIDGQSKYISSDHWTNNLNPFQEICRFDLLGTCNDDKCLGQHFGKCLLNANHKLVDLLLYDPKLAGILSEIPKRLDIELFDAINRKLSQFSQKQFDSNPKISLESHCRRIAEQIRKRSKAPAICLLTRRIPKLFNDNEIEVPFDDLKYKFNVKDKTFVINQTKIEELRPSADPDIYFKNRFYAPEGVPISAQLETSLANDSHNIQLWIKLAYYHISRCGENNFADAIDRALNVLSRGLECNRSEPELYEHFLFIYSNRMPRKDEDSKMSLNHVCRKVVQHCPHYRVWRCVLTLFTDINDKKTLSNELLNCLLNKSIPECHDFESRSHKILEIFLYKIHLNLEQNITNQTPLEFISALDRDCIDKTQYISESLTDSDLTFVWLCSTYLLIYNHLPNHCFEVTKQGFPQLINKKSFIFDWISLKNKFNFNAMKQHLIRAAEHCRQTKCFAIHLNLAELCFLYESDPKYYENLIEFTKNDLILQSLIVEHKLKTNEEKHNYIEILKQICVDLNENNIRIRLKIAKHYSKSHQFLNARNELILIVSEFYLNYKITENVVKQAFETLLLENEENDYNFELINARKSKESHCPVLWLSYILLLEMDCNSCERIDSVYQTALALCSVDKTDAKDLQLLWSNYLEFSIKSIENEKQFLDLFESVRHCCLTITDPLFQSQVIHYFCQTLPNTERSKALIRFAQLIPDNLDVTLSAIRCALEVKQMEVIWHLIHSIVFERKIRYKSLQFWKIAIGLAIERRDHLSVHKFLQMAVSLMPYNSNIWQIFKTYETTVNHCQHLSQGKDICDNQLKIGLF